VRTAFVPRPSYQLLVADFSAIEARVIAWLAKEKWRMDVFATHGKIYEASAEQMFHLTPGSVKKGDPERQKGKVAELALGYGGSVGALINMGALDMGLTEEELPDIVRRWREASPSIVRLWYTVERAALDTVENCGQTGCYGLLFTRESDHRTQQDFLTITLPRGRKLFYAHPSVADNQFGNPALHYMGIEQGTKKWTNISTFGGKLVENIVQAIARDCLAEVLLRLNAAGCQTVFHVHDEAVIDSPVNCLEQVLAMMAQPIEWAPGLLLKGDGSAMNYYRKE
jgi:DNA polymerase